MNLLNILGNDNTIKTSVFSTFNISEKPNFEVNDIPIHRTLYPGNASNLVSRIWYFFTSIAVPLFRMLAFKPDALMYFEPHSAFPAYIYKKFFNREVRIFIHYHEYYTKEEFKAPAMASVNFYHQREMDFLYKKAVWISQTNSDRLTFFSEDYPNIPKEKLHVLANYPPRSWYTENRTPVTDVTVKMFYIGALSFESTYIKEIVAFVSERSNTLSLDIYSYNIHPETKLFLERLTVSNIKFFNNGVPYDEIPTVARQYHLGLVLYKPHNLNYMYNAPNKLFEYLACGLDVWVPETLMGCKPYLNGDTKPNVRSVNFEQLTDDNLKYIVSNDQQYRKVEFNCENELQALINEIES